MYYKRKLESTLIQYLSAFPAVAVTGPRQSGKSTMLKQLLPEYTYITFDDPKIVELFEDDPEQFLKRYGDKVIFDEVQRMPTLFHYIKIAIDNDRQNYGKFILTGSAQFSLLNSITESLAGRVGMLTLLPFSFSEIPEATRAHSLPFGSYPELVNRQYHMKEQWYSAYVNTYFERDVRQIQNIGDLRDFKRLINLLAANVSQELNYSTYANDLGVAVNTIKRWISVLEASYILFLLPPYYENFGKRITKSPKVYFYDTGLVSYLTGTETFKQYDQGPMAGALFENYVISEILKKYRHENKNVDLYYYRAHQSTEIDLICDFKAYRHFIELKKSATFKVPMLKHLKKLFETGITTEDDKGFLVYNGDALDYNGHISAVNYQHYLLN